MKTIICTEDDIEKKYKDAVENRKVIFRIKDIFRDH